MMTTPESALPSGHHIGLQTWGSDGDIRPFFHLAATLRARGNRVTLLATSVDGKDYQELAIRSGVEYAAVASFPYQGEIAREFGRKMHDLGSPLRQLQLVTATFLDPIEGPIMAAARELASQCDLLVGHPILPHLGHAAEERGIPWVQVSPLPLTHPSSEYPPLGLPDLGPLLNRASWAMAGLALDWIALDRHNALRADLGLVPVHHLMSEMNRRSTILMAYSSALLTRPRDWPENLVVCGEMNLPDDLDDLPLDPLVEEFLAAGEPPLFVGFGSMSAFADPAGDQLALWRDGCREVGVRVIIQHPAATSRLASDRDCLAVTRLPHRPLFPRCRAIVHHGGAGTTHEACRAGRPSLVVPHILDQVFWGRRVQRIGAGPAPLALRKLRPHQFTRALRQLIGDPNYQAAAERVAAIMAAEDGVNAAAGVILRLAGRATGGSPLR